MSDRLDRGPKWLRRWLGIRAAVALTGAAMSVQAQSTNTMAPSAPSAPRGSAAWVVDMYYAKPSFPDEKTYVTAEFASRALRLPTVGSMIRHSASVNSRAIARTPDSETFDTEVSDSVRTQDWYTYLVRDGKIWKIRAIRTLLFPETFYGALDSLERTTSLSDSAAADEQRMRLVIRPDTALSNYLRVNQRQLTDLVRMFINETSIVAMDDRGRVRPAEAPMPSDGTAIVSQMRNLHIGALYRAQANAPCVFAKIGGVGHDQVGFYYADSSCIVPTMGPDAYMYIEKVTPSWYIYKTN